MKLYSVNWKDGMLITAKHLKEQERYFENLARWYRVGLADWYGLIKQSTTEGPAIVLDTLASMGTVRVTVTRCTALTPDGSFIEIGEPEEENVTAEVSVEEGVVPVYLSVNHEEKREIGDPDPSESVPRLPYRISSYHLHLNEPPGLPKGRYLQVASLVVSGGEVGFSDDFFPPCVSVYSDDRLAQKALDFRNRLEYLLSLCARAYRAITSNGSLTGEKTELQIAFRDTTSSLVSHLSSTIDGFILGRNAIHPLEMVTYFKNLFRVLSTLLNLRPSLIDYLNEKYFTKEAKSEVGKFMSSIDSFLLSDYDHRNIGPQVSMIAAILSQLRGVLQFLAQTREEDLGREATAEATLTYAGRTYRLVEYRSYEREQAGDLSYLFFDIEAPRPVEDTVVLMSKDLLSAAEWSNMQVRFGVNEARRLGETDPIDIDTVTFSTKVALRPHDMLRSDSVNRMTLIIRGSHDSEAFKKLGKLDLLIYAI